MTTRPTPPAELVVRAARTDADHEIARALLDEYVRATHAEALDHDVVGMPASIEGLERIIRDVADFATVYGTPRTVYLVGRRGDEVVGGVGVGRYDDATAEMKRLWVRDHARGGGTGRALAVAAVDAAAELGYRAMVLDVVPYRTAAISLYRSLGFVETEPLATYPFEMIAFRRELTHG